MPQILYEISGVTILTIASYIYQGRKRDILNSGKEALIANNVLVDGLKDTDNDISTEFLFKTVAIHLKSMLSLIAIGSDRGWSSFMLHLWCFLGTQIHIEQQTQLTHYAENILFVFVTVPSIYDTIYIISAADNRIIIMTAIMLATILKIKPLYNMNQLIIENMLAIIQTWLIMNVIVSK